MFDVICIGNATQDVFVGLPRLAVVKCRLQLECGTKQEVSSIFFSTGGGATNSAVSFSRLGLKTGIFAAIGNDEAGDAILEELRKEKVDTSMVARLRQFKTAYSVILTGFGGDRIILTYGGATTHLNKKGQVKWRELKKTKWLYVTSFHSTESIMREIFNFASKNGIKIAFNPGKSEIRQGLKKLAPLLKKAEIVFINKVESEMLTREKNVKKALKKLQKFTPIAVITEGKKGVHAFDGRNYYFKGTYAIKEADTTGGGDAFNSGFTAARILGKRVAEAMDWGMAQAQSVIMYLGAKNKLLTRGELKKFMQKWETGKTRVRASLP